MICPLPSPLLSMPSVSWVLGSKTTSAFFFFLKNFSRDFSIVGVVSVSDLLDLDGRIHACKAFEGFGVDPVLCFDFGLFTPVFTSDPVPVTEANSEVDGKNELVYEVKEEKEEGAGGGGGGGSVEEVNFGVERLLSRVEAEVLALALLVWLSGEEEADDLKNALIGLGEAVIALRSSR
ncbi:hypothetical protein BGZ80_007883 [Entomortierella chlamydospora]|uniref:Uncharacterized protein n=1 Tax=Entomortierella chlamydospora TaxID=101097 RepID=A0A9P6MXR1_9FUNG|nr:hypothetical protein BGZ80_007883 [Entomortierella chlamydospora]